MSALMALFKDKMTTSSAYGLVVLAILLGLVGVGNVRDQVVLAKNDAHYAARELAKLNAIKKSDVWSERVESSAKAKEAWENTRWQGETVGVLAAKIQQELITLADKAQLRKPQVKVSNELIEIDGETIMRFSLSGSTADHFATIKLLLAIAGEDKKIIVDDVVANFFTGNRSLIRLSGLAIVQVSNGVENAGEGA